MNHYNLQWLIDRFENGHEPEFTYFWGHTTHNENIDKTCLSQWYIAPFTVAGNTYKTAEHWMMAEKARLSGDMHAFEKIVQCQSPKEAKQIGREVQNFDTNAWDLHKFNIVVKGNIHKFNQNPELAKYLLNTGETIIVEASPSDFIWGAGLAADNPAIKNLYLWRGENLLGFALMEVRDFLRKFGHFKPLNDDFSAPWEQHPEFNSADIFWRMGKGEDIIVKFYKLYSNLNDRDKQIYNLTHLTPFDDGFL